MNMSNSLFKHEQISTTLPKAKELKPFVEKIITISKKGDLSSVRKINSILQDKKIEKKSFVDIEWKGFDIEDTWVYGYGMDDENGTMRQVLYITDE